MALKFDDASNEEEEIYYSTNPLPTDMTALTVFAWVRKDVENDNTTSNIAAHWDFPSDKGWVLAYVASADDYRFEVAYDDTNNTDGVNITGGRAAYDYTDWHWVCGRWRTNQVQVRVGQGTAASVTSATISRSSISDPSSAAFKIGSQGTAGSTNNNAWDGVMAEVAVWDVDLNVQEIFSMGKAGVRPVFIRPESLQFYASLQSVAAHHIDNLIGGEAGTLDGNGSNEPTTQLDHAPVRELWVPRSVSYEAAAVVVPDQSLYAHIRHRQRRYMTR